MKQENNNLANVTMFALIIITLCFIFLVIYFIDYSPYFSIIHLIGCVFVSILLIVWILLFAELWDCKK